MKPGNSTSIHPSVFSVILILTLMFVPISIFSQQKDLCKVTIESVECIKPSTGQDAYTEALFAGIEIAMQAGLAAATGGSSLTASAALQIGKKALKEGIKEGVKMSAGYLAEKFYTANKEQILGFAQRNAGDIVNDINQINESEEVKMLKELYDLTTLQGMFNKLYGESPDDLYIKVNGTKIWPAGKSVSIKSQQKLNVGAEYIFERSIGLKIQLMEYDYGSGDDDLGVIFFEIPPSFMGTDRVVDQVYYHKDEGSLYLVTFKVETLTKHRFINNINGSSWIKKEQVYNSYSRKTTEVTTAINFGPGTFGVSELPDPNKTTGFIWKIVDKDRISLWRGAYSQMATIAFNSENSFSGSSVIDPAMLQLGSKPGVITGTRATVQQTFQHRYINNLVGTSWNFSDPANANYSFSFGQGTINSIRPAGTFLETVTWKPIGIDAIELRTKEGATMNLLFSDQNNFSGYSWYNKSVVATGTIRQFQNQQQQTQTLLHRFINNIVGSYWTISEPNYGTNTFIFGQGTITNFSTPNTYWDRVTWRVAGNDIIELRTAAGATMNLHFNHPDYFSGNTWNNGSAVATGTRMQTQQQTFQHRFINDIVGTNWNFIYTNGFSLSFTIGQGIIYNISISGSGWEGVTWKVTGNDKIQFLATNGATMDLTFIDPYNFIGFDWNNQDFKITGYKF